MNARARMASVHVPALATARAARPRAPAQPLRNLPENLLEDAHWSLSGFFGDAFGFFVFAETPRLTRRSHPSSSLRHDRSS